MKLLVLLGRGASLKRKIYKPLLATLLLCGLSYDVLAAENIFDEKREIVAESTTKQASTDELRDAVQNPVASMISLPFQNNTDFNIGPDNKTKNTMNIQPYGPLNLTMTGT